MNLVVDDAVEVRQATKSEEEKRRQLGTRFYVVCVCVIMSDQSLTLFLGQILLKGDNVSLIQEVQQ